MNFRDKKVSKFDVAIKKKVAYLKRKEMLMNFKKFAKLTIAL